MKDVSPILDIDIYVYIQSVEVHTRIDDEIMYSTLSHRIVCCEHKVLSDPKICLFHTQKGDASLSSMA